MKRAERTALISFGAILLITAVWWALALWPTAQAAPAWLERTRSVCFGTQPDGLPDAYGWLVLTGQPLAMLLILFFGWGRDVFGGLRALSRSGVGRVALAFSAIVMAVGLGAVGARVQGASSAYAASGGAGAGDGGNTASAPVAEAVALDRAPPHLELIDQHGAVLDLEQFRGRPVLVTFAFGHCEAICPTVVREVLAARRELAERGVDAVAMIVTLDPWRDTPSRLPHIAEQWEMAYGEYLLSADVGSVEETLDAWDVGRQRDMTTGDVIHPRLIYLVSAEGRLVGATSGGIHDLTEALTLTE